MTTNIHNRKSNNGGQRNQHQTQQQTSQRPTTAQQTTTAQRRTIFDQYPDQAPGLLAFAVRCYANYMNTKPEYEKTISMGEFINDATLWHKGMPKEKQRKDE